MKDKSEFPDFGGRVCLECYPEYRRQKAQAFVEKNPDYFKDRYANNEEYRDNRKNSQYLNRYGITLEEYNQLLENQNGGCAICGTANAGKDRKYFCIDHNHKTGKVRGLLCPKCNQGIGLLQDSPRILIAAAEYLKKSS